MGVGWLFLGGDGWVDIEMGTDECWVNPWSVAGIPCKYVNIFFSETRSTLPSPEEAVEPLLTRTSPGYHQ